ncbi:hypothetical protein ACQ4PT_058738 [Festuca glaucescens]
MGRQPSLESRATTKKRWDRSASLASASVSAPSRTTSAKAKPPRSGELVVLPTPAEAPTSPLHPEYEYEEDEYDMNDEMSESLPSHVSVDSGSKDEDGSVDGGGGSPKPKRCKRKKGVQVSSKPKAKRGRAMADAMLDKFDKYWEEKNNVMALATILDPRWKMRWIRGSYIDNKSPKVKDEDDDVELVPFPECVVASS